MEFIGRKNESDLLKKWDGRESMISVIYGRRRVGKTRLIEETFKNDKIFKFEGIEGQNIHESQREFFRQMVALFSLSELHGFQPVGWQGLFVQLSKAIGAKQCIVLFDEFQWMAGEREAMISELKFAWDNQFIKNNKVHLILCGSVSSFMVKKVLRSRALYGRIKVEIQLQPLTIPEVVPAFINKRSLQDILELYMVTGGIPQYLKMVDPIKSPLLNIENLCFSRNGFLVNELDRIFISHFGKNPHYRCIVSFLAKNRWSDRDELKKQCGMESGGRITSYLEDLILAGFIEKFSCLKSGKESGKARYRLSDFYLLFYFNFIDGTIKKIQNSSQQLPISHYLPDQKYSSWQGSAFERICIAHQQLIADKLGFGAVRYDAGSWFSSGVSEKKAQIDLLYIRADRVITVCEIKYSGKPPNKQLIEDMERKIGCFPNKKKYAMEKALICLTPPTKELINEGYFNAILTAENIFSQPKIRI